MTSVFPALWKSAVFVAVTTLATLMLAFTIHNSSSTEGTTYRAVFTEAPSLNRGDDVRMAGVRVGQISEIEVVDDRYAEITFSVASNIELTEDVTAELRYRNLIGQRYLALEQGLETAGDLEAGATIPMERTLPALDLTQLFNGFQPLFRLLSPEDVNELSSQIIAVFQGEAGTVDSLIANTAELVDTLAAKDEVIGDIITNLDAVMDTLDARNTQVSDLIESLDLLVTGLAQDRTTIGEAVEGMGLLTTNVADFLGDVRPPLKGSIANLGALADNLAAEDDAIDRVLANLPKKAQRLGRTVSYGSWINFYLCSAGGNIPDVDGYVGSVGVDAVARRCGA